MELFSEEDRSQHSEKRLALITALAALITVAVVFLGGAWFLTRSGLLDALLGAATPPPDTGGTPTLLSLVQTRQPTAPPIVTATPRQTMTTSQPTLTPTPLAPAATPSPTPSSTPSPTATPTDPLAGKFVVEYKGCTPHGSNQGTVKGQIFDRNGDIIVGAEVRITLNGWAYDQPARSNGAGWYEFYLQNDLKVKIVSLRINGQEMPLAGNDLEFKAQGGCFEYVNLRQH